MGFSEPNALEFIKLYNIIDDCLSKSLSVEKNDMSFTQKVNTLRTKGDHIISRFYVELLIYAKLRNVIVQSIYFLSKGHVVFLYAQAFAETVVNYII